MQRYNFKDIARFNQIAEILGIEFQEAGDLFSILKKRTIEQNYQAMLDEIEIEEWADAFPQGGDKTSECGGY
jgi:hypothetical protein